MTTTSISLDKVDSKLFNEAMERWQRMTEEEKKSFLKNDSKQDATK